MSGRSDFKDIEKRVVLFSHASDLSGAPLALVQLARCLPKFDWHPLLLLPKPGPIETKLRAWNIEYEILSLPLKPLDFIRKVKRMDPALIHVNSLVKTWPVLVSRLIKRPVIWHVHEYLNDKRLYAKVIHLIADGVILISHEQYSLFDKLIKAARIPNGIDLERFKNVSLAQLFSCKRDDVRTIVAYIGRIEPNKGFRILAQAAALLKERSWIHYVVVGSTPKGQEKYTDETLKYIEREGLEGVFHCLGVRRDIPEILASCDILCHPSYSDTFPLVIMEAMASSLPVIGTSVGEVPSIIEEGITGFVIKPGDPESLADRIKRLDYDPDLRRSMGLAGKTRVKKEYEIGLHAGRVAEFYKKVLARGS